MAPPAANKPNLFQLHGNHLQVTYSTSGIDGKPHFTYHDPHQTHSFSGAEIRTLASEIGTLVTVTIRKTVDAGSTSFTLVVPNVNLDATNKASIKTFGVTTLHKLSIVPAFNLGQTETYAVTELSGSASFVLF